MVTNKSSPIPVAANNNNNKKNKKKRTRLPVQVVQCPGDFPTNMHMHKKKRQPQSQQTHVEETYHNNNNTNTNNDLDWKDTTRQVRAFVSTTTTSSCLHNGKTKNNSTHISPEEYKRLTGRKPQQPQQHVPPNIRRGIQKKRKERYARQVQEARVNGIVLPVLFSHHDDEEHVKHKKIHNHKEGPAPSIGYMKHGVYRVEVSKPTKPRR